jgi:hypothetical protein
MALKKRGKCRYGDSQADIRTEVLRYSKANAYLAHHFADATCKCGGGRGVVTCPLDPRQVDSKK